MKRFFKYIAVALAMSLLALGCTPEIMTPDKSQLPEAGKLVPKITIDQATNYVTFSVEDAKGMVPLWIFGEEKIDGKADKTYAYTGNGVTLRIREAGEHAVELKAYNANGISVGSQIVKFTLENTYRDPFDPSPYMKAIAGEWMWNNEVAGHFGCGGSLDAPIGWWPAGANEKKDWSMYDDRMTFTEDGKYSFDPGDGKVYVHNSITSLGTSPDGADYLVDMEAYETTYKIENNWNDAGIEEIWLVLPAKSNLSYISGEQMYADPRWMFVETKTSAIKKELKLAANLAPNMPDKPEEMITWYYNFIPAVKVLTPEEMLAGTDAAGKVWVMDSATKGHLGCGPAVDDPVSWWSANPDEKAASGMYDDEVTFFPDGKYVYNPGPDGKLYINFATTALGGPGGESGTDLDIDYDVTEATYTFDGENLTLAANTPMIYVPSNAMYETPAFKVTAISETSVTLVALNEGCWWQYILKARDVQGPAGPTLNGEELPAELTVAQNDVLTVGNLNLADIWVDPDFFEVDGANLKFKAVDGDYKFTYDATNKWIKVVPMVNGEKATYDNGKALWIIGDGGGKPTVGQLIGWAEGDAPLPMAQIGANKYQITLAMKAEGGSIKVFGQSGWGTEWTKDKYGTVTGNDLFHIPADDGNIHTADANKDNAGYYVFTVVDNDGILDLTVDTVKETVWDPASTEHNMWLNMNVLSTTYHYAPNWEKIADPTVEQNGNSYTISLPTATTDQWQAQFATHTDMSSSKDKTYDFMCKLVSNSDHPGVTIKLVLSGGGDNDKIFYFEGRHALKADEEYVYKMDNMPGIDMEKISLFFDFGGNAENTEVTISDILFQEHRAE